MKKLSILSLLLCLCLFFVTGCEFGAKSTTAKPTDTTTKKTTTEKTTTTPASELINDNGIFTIARSYTFNFSSQSEGITVSQRLSFDTNGNMTLTNLDTNAEKEYTYSIDDTNLITCTSKADSTNIDYYYYFVDVIVSADSFLMPGTLDGEAVSQRGTGTLGYVAFIKLNKGDLPAVLSNDSATNKYYAIRKNGTLGTTAKNVIADQLGLFDTATARRYATTLTVGSGSSQKICPVIVVVQDTN